ncbi:MAG: hypothetical protein KKF44_04570 [Nanoarchaeota archaeon]|nr:hypothetical protein [Nanoarchaeota archaeon]
MKINLKIYLLFIIITCCLFLQACGGGKSNSGELTFSEQEQSSVDYLIDFIEEKPINDVPNNNGNFPQYNPTVQKYDTECDNYHEKENCEDHGCYFIEDYFTDPTNYEQMSILAATHLHYNHDLAGIVQGTSVFRQLHSPVEGQRHIDILLELDDNFLDTLYIEIDEIFTITIVDNSIDDTLLTSEEAGYNKGGTYFKIEPGYYKKLQIGISGFSDTFTLRKIVAFKSFENRCVPSDCNLFEDDYYGCVANGCTFHSKPIPLNNEQISILPDEAFKLDREDRKMFDGNFIHNIRSESSNGEENPVTLKIDFGESYQIEKFNIMMPNDNIIDLSVNGHELIGEMHVDGNNRYENRFDYGVVTEGFELILQSLSSSIIFLTDAEIYGWNPEFGDCRKSCELEGGVRCNSRCANAKIDVYEDDSESICCDSCGCDDDYDGFFEDLDESCVLESNEDYCRASSLFWPVDEKGCLKEKIKSNVLIFTTNSIIEELSKDNLIQSYVSSIENDGYHRPIIIRVDSKKDRHLCGIGDIDFGENIDQQDMQNLIGNCILSLGLKEEDIYAILIGGLNDIPMFKYIFGDKDEEDFFLTDEMYFQKLRKMGLQVYFGRIPRGIDNDMTTLFNYIQNAVLLHNKGGINLADDSEFDFLLMKEKDPDKEDIFDYTRISTETFIKKYFDECNMILCKDNKVEEDCCFYSPEENDLTNLFEPRNLFIMLHGNRMDGSTQQEYSNDVHEVILDRDELLTREYKDKVILLAPCWGGSINAPLDKSNQLTFVEQMALIVVGANYKTYSKAGYGLGYDHYVDELCGHGSSYDNRKILDCYFDYLYPHLFLELHETLGEAIGKARLAYYEEQEAENNEEVMETYLYYQTYMDPTIRLGENSKKAGVLKAGDFT